MRDGGTGNVLVLITILLIRQLSNREIVSEGLESSHEGEATTTGDDARAGDEDESGDGRGGANDEGGDDGENTT